MSDRVKLARESAITAGLGDGIVKFDAGFARCPWTPSLRLMVV